ncbi:LysR family transcriptional regulator [Bosea sp. PAMC 26642]|uniref:LysR family transcriptional regulator n=1 Tax=Bosea sp. (strain PAMC 26642) TaxID=1792307 RepID=UPI0007704B74|nr:LysR family transcriptional regulator [Bosea sp. PAMC 26642]AMJ62747.1 LysR family transcriptional regulator [Bosea sp. PAMC 26642]
MNLRFLETFVWVARLRSFSVAAEKLCTTQAAVSNRIATLERELGVRLFERDLRNVSLTAHGQRALAQAETIVRMVGEFERSVGDTNTLSGSVMIGTVDSIVYAWLPKLIERVKASYPNVTIDLNVDTSLNLARQMQDGQIDLGLIMGPVVAPHIRNIELCSFDCLWIGAATLGLDGRPLTLAELTDYPIFAYSKGSQPHQAVLRLVETSGMGQGLVRVYNSNSLATITRLIRDGVGIAVLPRVVVREFLDNGELRVLDVEAKLPALHFHAVFTDNPGNLLPSLLADMAVEIAADFVAD